MGRNASGQKTAVQEWIDCHLERCIVIGTDSSDGYRAWAQCSMYGPRQVAYHADGPTPESALRSLEAKLATSSEDAE